MVALTVAEPAVVSLTVHDHVQLDRLTGTSAERHGDLLPSGTTPVRLAAGTYVFRTTGGGARTLESAPCGSMSTDGGSHLAPVT
jgi:hypothetical protein